MSSRARTLGASDNVALITLRYDGQRWWQLGDDKCIVVTWPKPLPGFNRMEYGHEPTPAEIADLNADDRAG